MTKGIEGLPTKVFFRTFPLSFHPDAKLAAQAVVAVTVVLLIAVINVAGLLLARGIARQKEIATRLVLGASSSRIVRQLLTESLLVTVTGGLAGVLLARWGALILQRLAGTPDLNVSVDRDTLILAVAASLVAGVLAGIAPAWRARRLNLIAGLRSRSAISDLASAGAKWNWGNLMVGGQIALSVTVLFAATLLTRSLQNLNKRGAMPAAPNARERPRLNGRIPRVAITPLDSGLLLGPGGSLFVEALHVATAEATNQAQTSEAVARLLHQTRFSKRAAVNRFESRFHPEMRQQLRRRDNPTVGYFKAALPRQ